MTVCHAVVERREQDRFRGPGSTEEHDLRILNQNRISDLDQQGASLLGYPQIGE